MTACSETYQTPSPREIRIEYFINLLGLTDRAEIARFRTMAEFVDAFIWRQQFIDLRRPEE